METIFTKGGVGHQMYFIEGSSAARDRRPWEDDVYGCLFKGTNHGCFHDVSIFGKISHDIP